MLTDDSWWTIGELCRLSAPPDPMDAKEPLQVRTEGIEAGQTSVPTGPAVDRIALAISTMISSQDMCIGATVCLDRCMRRCMRAHSQSRNASAECKESVEAHNRRFFAHAQASPVTNPCGCNHGLSHSGRPSTTASSHAWKHESQVFSKCCRPAAHHHCSTGLGHGAPIIPTQKRLATSLAT